MAPQVGRLGLEDHFLVTLEALEPPWQPGVKAPRVPDQPGLCSCLSCGGLLLIQVFLEANEHLADLIWSSQIGNGIGDGVVILEPQ